MSDVISLLHTEQRNHETKEISSASTREMLEMINREDQKVAGCVYQVLDAVADAVDSIVPKMRKGGRIVYVGAGTSGRLGYMDAAECPPTYGVASDTVSCVMAGGRDAVFSAREGVEDCPDQAVADLKEHGLTALDTVIAISASGRTPYCVGALDYAREIGAGAIAVACNPGSVMGRHADIKIEPDTGCEVIMGSTRMKAGTAQKMILNMISTSVMVRLGRTCSNLMVCLHCKNEKISNRIVRLFQEATGCKDAQHANDMILRAQGDTAVAVLMERTGCSYEDAAQAMASLKHFGEAEKHLTR